MKRDITPGVAIVACLVLIAGALPAQDLIHRITPANGETLSSLPFAGVGDLDADGHDDLAVTFLNATTTSSTSTVRVFSGADKSVLLTITATSGNSVGKLRGIGDVNGDNVPDIVVGEQSAWNTVPGLPTAAVGATVAIMPPIMPGGTVQICSGFDGSVIRTFQDPLSSGYGFGIEFTVVGDVNSDGVDDVAISNPFASTNGLNSNGTVHVMDGATGALVVTIDGTKDWQAFGISLDAAGDVNSDGIADLLVARANPQSATSPGGPDEAVVYDGQTGAILSVLTNIGSTSQYRGAIVAGGDDIDGDGTNDVVFGIAWSGNLNRGEITAVSGADGSVLFTKIGQPCQGLGATLDLADVNADGHADVITTNQPDIPSIAKQAFVIDGVTGDFMITILGSASGVTRAFCVGDLDADGYKDVAIDRDAWLPTAAIEAYMGGPALGSQADSMVGASSGAPEDVLKINGSAGGQIHCVGCDLGTTITFSIDQPSMNAQPADFVLFGRVGVPFNDEQYAVPTVAGDMVLVPAPLATWAIPSVFTLASSVGNMPGGVVLQTPPAPWSLSLPGGFNFPTEFTLQGVIMETPTRAVATNAVIVRVH